MAKHLIWIDLEMTGLDPETYVIVEIASIVTDDQLNLVAEGPDIAINQPDAILRSMEPWSLEHHPGLGVDGSHQGLLLHLCSGRSGDPFIPFQILRKGRIPSLRQFHRSGPPFSGEVHADPGGLFSLPQYRRQYHQGTGQTMVPCPFSV